MKVFLDANVLISVLNKEYPVFPFSSRMLSLADDTRLSLYTSPLCLAIAFYFSEKKSGTAQAREKITLLVHKLQITLLGAESVEQAISNKKIHDVEDGMQYYSALESGCQCIVTENLKDFYFSEIEVLTSRGFLERYVF